MRRIANSKIMKNKHDNNYNNACILDEEILPFHNLTKERLEKAEEILE